VRRRVAKQILEQETTEVGSASLSAKHLYQSLRLIDFAKNILNDFRSDLKIICSIDDDVVSPTTIDWISKSISSSTCKIIWLGGSYHIITLDNEREIVVNESVEFIQEALFKRKAIVEYSSDVKELIIRDRIIE
jgi:carboxylesterase